MASSTATTKAAVLTPRVLRALHQQATVLVVTGTGKSSSPQRILLSRNRPPTFSAADASGSYIPTQPRVYTTQSAPRSRPQSLHVSKKLPITRLQPKMGELDDFMDQMGSRRSASGTPPPAADPSSSEQGNSKKRKNAKEPEANKKPKVMENKAIWISNLPPDTTKKELEEEFSRYGIIDKGANGEPRIRMEEKDGVFTGNAMIVYFKKEAIANAVRLMDDYPLRLGDTSHGNIHVEPASIETKKERDGEKIASKLTRKDRKASERNRAELNRKLNEWSDNEEEVAETFVAKKNKWAKVVIIKNIFDLDQLEDDPKAYLEIKEDMRGAAEGYGDVTNCTLYDREPEGIVTVRFREFEPAEEFVAGFQGRRYNKRALQLSLAEDKPRFKKSGRGETPDSDDEEPLAKAKA